MSRPDLKRPHIRLRGTIEPGAELALETPTMLRPAVVYEIELVRAADIWLTSVRVGESEQLVHPGRENAISLKVPGLTDAERAQALTTLGAHQTMHNVMTSGILSELGKPKAAAHQCLDARNERCTPDHCEVAGCPHAQGARRGTE